MLASTDQDTLRLVLARGGTSKGLYFHEQDIPAPGPERDALLCRLMGSPDVKEIDGLGGAVPVTSKLAIVRPSSRDDADVEYTFGQVDIATAAVDYGGNCGNISSGVGPFAVDEGLVEVSEPTTTVRIHNTNTDKVLVAEVPVVGGRAAVVGDTAIPGVPGTGAAISMDWKATVGSATGVLLPTGHATDRVTLENGALAGRAVTVSICDAGNVAAWFDAADIGMTGSETAEQIEGDPDVMTAYQEIRAKAAALAGLVDDWHDADRPQQGLPLTGAVAGPGDYATPNGDRITADQVDVCVRLMFLNKLHPTIAGTGSMSFTACSRVPGSTVNRAAVADPASGALRIGHPGGSMTTYVETAPDAAGDTPTFTKLAMIRTARRLMAGLAYVPVTDRPTPRRHDTATVHEGE